MTEKTMKKKPKTRIAKKIIELRLKQKLNTSQLAESADIPKNTLYLIEREERCDPSIKTLRKLADALGVPISELLGERDVDDISKLKAFYDKYGAINELPHDKRREILNYINVVAAAEKAKK